MNGLQPSAAAGRGPFHLRRPSPPDAGSMNFKVDQEGGELFISSSTIHAEPTGGFSLRRARHGSSGAGIGTRGRFGCRVVSPALALPRKLRLFWRSLALSMAISSLSRSRPCSATIVPSRCVGGIGQSCSYPPRETKYPSTWNDATTARRNPGGFLLGHSPRSAAISSPVSAWREPALPSISSWSVAMGFAMCHAIHEALPR